MRAMRGFFTALMALCWGTVAWATAPYCAELPGGCALINEAGAFLTAMGAYDEMLCIEPGQVYLGGSAGAYYILNGEGEMISTLEVNMARYVNDTILFRWNDLYGVMDLSGKVLINPTWVQLTPNGQGGYLALSDHATDNVADAITYIDPLGNIIETGNTTVGLLEDVVEDRMPYMTTDGSYGYVNGRGEKVTEAIWLYAAGFENGGAIVSDEAGMGLVDVDGNAILPCGYAFLERNDRLLVGLTQDGVLEVYKADGRQLMYTIDAQNQSVALVGSCFALYDGEATALYNVEGQCIYTGSARATFSEGHRGYIIVSDGEWGEACVFLMDMAGNAISEMYPRIMALSGNRYAYMTLQGATYYSQPLKRYKRSWNYESLRYGMLDGEGQVLLADEYLEILALDDDRFLLRGEDEMALADESGAIIARWQMDEEILTSGQ